MPDLGIGMAVIGGITLLFVLLTAIGHALSVGPSGAYWLAGFISGSALLAAGISMARRG